MVFSRRIDIRIETLVYFIGVILDSHYHMRPINLLGIRFVTATPEALDELYSAYSYT